MADSSSSFSKTYLRNFCNGKLEFTGRSLKFYVEKGRLKKQKEIAKEVFLNTLENVTLESNELTVVSNGVTDRFVIEDKKLAEAIYAKTNELLKEQGQTSSEHEELADIEPTLNVPSNIEPTNIEQSVDKHTSEVVEQTEPAPPVGVEPVDVESAEARTLPLEDKPPMEKQPTDVVPEPKQINLINSLNATLPIIDLLFDVLGSLNGSVDWHRMKIYANQIEEKTQDFEILESGAISLGFSKLLSNIQDRDAEAIPKEAYALLESIYAGFQELTCRDSLIGQNNPNPTEVMTVIEFWYELNDVGLASIVEDENVKDEINHLVAKLESLIADNTLTMDPQQIIDLLKKFGVDKEPKEIIVKSRALLKEQLHLLEKCD
jgi:hypothetical protein